MNNTLATDPFAFIKEPNKLSLLISANEALHMNKRTNKKLIFVYSAPKVGSTSVVSSLRLFGIETMDIIHIHDETMLQVLANIKGITVNELILYNKYLGRDVYVINIYRSPIERKISTFFEKIGSYHFNNHDINVNTYGVDKVIKRFNDIFFWIDNGDHFIDKYNIIVPSRFDHTNKHLLVIENGIHYITLRLKDSSYWSTILTRLFGVPIHIIKDYESTNKPIKDLYTRFKQTYKIPENYLESLINNDTYLQYYYSTDELTEYKKLWQTKGTSSPWTGFTKSEYELYKNITLENSHIDTIQLDHYFDEGCTCKACNIKRMETKAKLMRGIPATERIIHVEAKNELIKRRVSRATKINHFINSRRASANDLRISLKRFM